MRNLSQKKNYGKPTMRIVGAGSSENCTSTAEKINNVFLSCLDKGCGQEDQSSIVSDEEKDPILRKQNNQGRARFSLEEEKRNERYKQMQDEELDDDEFDEEYDELGNLDSVLQHKRTSARRYRNGTLNSKTSDVEQMLHTIGNLSLTTGNSLSCDKVNESSFALDDTTAAFQLGK